VFTEHGIVRHISSVHRDLSRTCRGTYVHRKVGLQVTAISAVNAPCIAKAENRVGLIKMQV